jgi:hypothetical protein
MVADKEPPKSETNKLPEVQYALFCREVIEGKEDWELTFKGVTHGILVKQPQNILITLVLRLLNVKKGLHKLDINCVALPDQLLKWNCEINARKSGNSFFTQELEIPIQQTNECIFTILYDGNPLKRLRLPIRVLAQS